MRRRFIILTVVSQGARVGRQSALQLDLLDRNLTLTSERLRIEMDGDPIEIINGLGSYRRWGRVTHLEVHNWIRRHGLHQTPNGRPAKLIFQHSVRGNLHHLKFYDYQANLI